MVFYLKADEFSPEIRELARMFPKAEQPPPATLNDFSPAEWAVVKMARQACLATGGFPAVSGESAMARHLRETAEFDARNPSPLPRRRAAPR